MSLLDEAMEEFKIMNKSKVSDGYGGYVTTWTEGAGINAAAVLDQSVEALTAKAQGVTGIYTITTKKSLTLEYHDVIKRVSDGKIFRITSDGDDAKTPNSASINMRQVRAEEWSLS